MLELRGIAAGYGGLSVIHGIDLSVAPARSWRWSAPTAPARRRW